MTGMKLYRIPTCALRDAGKACVTNWYTYVRAESSIDAASKAIRLQGYSVYCGEPEEVGQAEPGAAILE